MRYFAALLIVASVFASCGKDDQNPTNPPSSVGLADNLNGSWFVTRLDYTADYPYRVGNTVTYIPITGYADSCGNVNFVKSTSGCDYNIKYKPVISGGLSLDTVRIKGNGLYTVKSEKSILISDTATKQSLDVEITKNTTNQIGWKIISPYVNGKDTFPVTIDIQLQRK